MNRRRNGPGLVTRRTVVATLIFPLLVVVNLYSLGMPVGLVVTLALLCAGGEDMRSLSCFMSALGFTSAAVMCAAIWPRHQSEPRDL
jgi:hypothetical protein